MTSSTTHDRLTAQRKRQLTDYIAVRDQNERLRRDAVCKCCEGSGRAFNAIDAEWDMCLYCRGSGKPREKELAAERRK